MADPRHPMRDNSRALGLVSDKGKSAAAYRDEEATASGDDFARALDAALDAIRTAIDEEPEAEMAVVQPAEQPQPNADWTMPPVNDVAPRMRDQRAFREISSDIASRHPELRPAPTPMPATATLASRPLGGQPATPKKPLSYEPYTPHSAPARGSDSGMHPPAYGAIPANDGAPQRGRDTASRDNGSRETAGRPASRERTAYQPEAPVADDGSDPYWSQLVSDIQHDLDGKPQARQTRQTREPVQSQPAPRSRAVQPEDLPAFGRNHDEAPADKPRGLGRMLVVSSLALTAAIGFAAATVWLGNDMANIGESGDVAGLTTTPAPQRIASLPAATSDNPARLQVSAVNGTAGEAVPLSVGLTAAPGERTAVLVSGLPEDGKLSAGVDTGKGVWIVKPSDLNGLALTTASAKPAEADIKFELVASNGLTLDVQSARVSLEAGSVSQPVAAEPVTAGLAPKPVKTATLTFGASSQQATPELASAKENSLPAPPIAPRADVPTTGSGGGSLSAAPEPGSVQIAVPQRKSEAPAQNVAKAPVPASAAAQQVRVAAISPTNAQPPAKRIATPAPVSPEIKDMVERGHALMSIGDLASARLFYERAAEAGSAEAALAMAKSFDPLYFEEQDVHGMPPNPERALKWYEKAVQMGAPEATGRLSALKARLQRS